MWEPSIKERSKGRENNVKNSLNVTRSSFCICLKARVFVCVLKLHKIH